MTRLMQKFFVMLLSCLLLSASFFCRPQTVSGTELIPVTPEIPFALIEQPDTILYEKNEVLNSFTPLTSLPKTHFVTVAEYYNAEYYRVLYHDLSGFVKRTDVSIVDYEPVTKDALGKLIISADVSGVFLRAKPDHLADNVLAELARGESLYYYGTLNGTSPNISGNVEWYYVTTQDDVKGYLYSAYVTATPIGENTFEKVMREAPQPPPDPLEPIQTTLSPVLTAVLIAALCVPAAIVMILLFQKPPQKKREPRF